MLLQWNRNAANNSVCVCVCAVSNSLVYVLHRRIKKLVDICALCMCVCPPPVVSPYQTVYSLINLTLCSPPTSQVPLPQSPPWWLLYDAHYEDIEDICLEVLSLYRRPKVFLEQLEKKISVHKKELQVCFSLLSCIKLLQQLQLYAVGQVLVA